MAMKIAMAIKSKGYFFLREPSSNQIFPIFPNSLIKKLQEKYDFYTWKKIDTENSAIRIVTSWATKSDVANEFISDLE